MRVVAMTPEEISRLAPADRASIVQVVCSLLFFGEKEFLIQSLLHTASVTWNAYITCYKRLRHLNR